MSANRFKENDQEKQVKNEPIDDQYLDGNVGNSMRNMDSEVSISSQIHSKNMKSGTIDENGCNESMNPCSQRTMPSHQCQQMDQHPNAYEQTIRTCQVPWITWRRPSDIPSISSETTSVEIPEISTVSKGNMDSESTLLPSEIHSINMKSGAIDENACNESMNPSIERMPPHHQIGQTSSISSSISSEIHKESRILKRKSDSETTLLPSSINIKKVKNEEIFDEAVHKTMEIKTEENSIQTFYSCQNVHKYWFNTFNIKKETDLDRQFKWLQNKGLKNGFEPRQMSSEVMRIKNKEPRVIQRFCVTSKEEADQVRKLISSQKWVKCLFLTNIKGGTPSIWDLMQQEDIVIPMLIATKAYYDNESDLEMDEMTKRCESNDSIRMALSNWKIIKYARKAFDAEAKAKLDHFCDKLGVEKSWKKLKIEEKRRREEENEQKEEREFNANSR